tara:strand:- start:699 stop:893 length:195 start_codon:yes stop_codon:yes gene_type:complete
MSKKSETQDQTFQFDKFMKDLDKRTKKRDTRTKELSEAEEVTANRRRAAQNREDWRQRVKWTRK